MQFVTGAAQGIGKAIALRLARDGYNVAVADLPVHDLLLNEVVKEIEGYGRKGIPIHCDVRDEEQVKEMVDTTVRNFGHLNAVRFYP